MDAAGDAASAKIHRAQFATTLLALGSIFVVSCSGDDDASTTDAGGASDAGEATDAAPVTDAAGVIDGGPVGRDAGPIRVDAGPCDAPSGIDFGDPIEAPAGEWTFVEFPGSRCMNDTPTGIGINPSATSDNLVIYLEGGGACFDPVSCFTVSHQGGFGAAELADTAAYYGDRGLFDREDPSNPVADWSFVFVPYCTGDVHAGDNPSGYGGRVQVGYRNVGEYLERIVPTFDGATQVLLTGSSAGGFGAAYNFDRVQRAFGCTEVTLLDDAGPPMSDAYMRPCLQQWWRETWNLNDTLPADCVWCTQDDGGGLVNFAPYLAAKYPERRFGLLSTMEDGVIRSFFGYGYHPTCRAPRNMPAEDFRAGLLDLRETVLGPYPSFKTYYAEGDSHTFLGRPLTDVSVEGVTLAEWIRRLLEDDPTWDEVGP